MKKTQILIIAMLLAGLISRDSMSQTKVTFNLVNPRVTSGYFLYDLTATIPSGQSWRVGSSNIRVNFTGTPLNSLTAKADNPVLNPNTNISGANGYQTMTTTSILSGTAISLNILTFNTSGFYKFTPGTYTIGTIRWIINGTVTNTQMEFRVPPASTSTVVFDSLVSLVHGTTFSTVNPVITGNFNITENIPTEYNLYQNYPNPFNPTTTIQFDVPRDSEVEIFIFDITGKMVTELVNGRLEAGRYEYHWNAQALSSGVYICTFRSGDFYKVNRMILLK